MHDGCCVKLLVLARAGTFKETRDQPSEEGRGQHSIDTSDRWAVWTHWTHGGASC